LPENAPQTQRTEGGLLVLEYLVQVGNQVVLDGFQTPAAVAFTSEVLWEQDPEDTVEVTIADELSVRTFFFANEVAVYHFILTVSGEEKARYVFDVVSPTLYAADVNHDGKYTFNPDLVNLFRIWNDLSDRATATLAGVIQRLVTSE
jgi:hypothetical protein